MLIHSNVWCTCVCVCVYVCEYFVFFFLSAEKKRAALLKAEDLRGPNQQSSRAEILIRAGQKGVKWNLQEGSRCFSSSWAEDPNFKREKQWSCLWGRQRLELCFTVPKAHSSCTDLQHWWDKAAFCLIGEQWSERGQVEPTRQQKHKVSGQNCFYSWNLPSFTVILKILVFFKVYRNTAKKSFVFTIKQIECYWSFRALQGSMFYWHNVLFSLKKYIETKLFPRTIKHFK